MSVFNKFKYNQHNANVVRQVIRLEGTPEAIQYFARICSVITDDCYWLTLSTLWVSYSGNSDLNLWRHLFSSERDGRKRHIMKRDERKALERLPHKVTAYRAHRKGESDWIAYTLDVDIAIRFCKQRGEGSYIAAYSIKKSDILALFTRRSEQEILVLDPKKAEFMSVVWRF